MPKYYLRIEKEVGRLKWVDREFEISEDEYAKTYRLLSKNAGPPTTALPDSFRVGVVHGRVDRTEGGEWFEVEWRKPAQHDPPTDDEKQYVMEMIKKKAKKERVFEMYVTGAIYKWLKENLKNAYIELISQMDDVSHLNDHWIAIGVTEAATKKLVSRI